VVPESCGTTTVVVPELGGTTTVVARFGGGLLLTQPQRMAPTTRKLDAIFIYVSSFHIRF
jgi:hypothetical protein